MRIDRRVNTMKKQAVIFFVIVLFIFCSCKMTSMPLSNENSNSNDSFSTIDSSNSDEIYGEKFEFQVDGTATSEQINETVNILKKRMELLDFPYYNCTANGNVITISVPENSCNDEDKQQIEDITAKGEFSIKEGNSNNGREIINHSHIKDASCYGLGKKENTVSVIIKMNKYGKLVFSEETEKISGKAISLWMDSEKICTEIISEQINDGKIIIDAGFSLREGLVFSALVATNPLPVSLKVSR